MKFARIVFVIAGVWGIVVITPLYFLHYVTGSPMRPRPCICISSTAFSRRRWRGRLRFW